MGVVVFLFRSFGFVFFLFFRFGLLSDLVVGLFFLLRVRGRWRLIWVFVLGDKAFG